MTEPDYKKIYADLTSRVSQLCHNRDELELQLGDIKTQIANLRHTLRHLGPLAGYTYEVESLSDLGITDAVRSVLDPGSKLSSRDVKERMEARGFDFSKYSVPDASIRTILKRLVDAKPAQAIVEKEGWKTFYSGVPIEISDEDIPF